MLKWAVQVMRWRDTRAHRPAICMRNRCTHYTCTISEQPLLAKASTCVEKYDNTCIGNVANNALLLPWPLTMLCTGIATPSVTAHVSTSTTASVMENTDRMYTGNSGPVTTSTTSAVRYGFRCYGSLYHAAVACRTQVYCR